MDLCGDYVVIVRMHFCGKEDVEIESVDQSDLTFEEGEIADQMIFATTCDYVGLVDLSLHPSALLISCRHFFLAREDMEGMLIL